MNNRVKKKRWHWITVVAAVAVIAVLAVMMLPKPTNAILNARSVEATKGNISVTVVGSGNLEYDDTVDIEAPSGITIDKVIAESGDAISAGDTLATVDSVSLKTKIASVRDEISSLDRQINYIKEDTEPETVTTKVSGRVKKIYVSKGDSVLDVTSENDALMLISIDEKMAVDFESTAKLSVGDKVNVILENGNSKKGTVEKANGSQYTVTLTDNGPKLGEAVTIKSTDGDVLSNGELYINQPVKVVATSGTVKTIHVTENQKVSSGKKLITLKNLPASADYEKLLADRDDLVKTLDTLLAYSKTNSIIADSDGVIKDVNIEDGKEVTAASDDTSNAVAFTQAPNENLVLTVEIDELDILSIKKDMEAEITFDAIPDKTFNGKITKIADSAEASDGVAKYTVKVLIPRDDSMKAGMNATATILVEQKENILIIPVAALQEFGGRVFVYTKEDIQTGVLSGETEVTTGVSDGEYVEILSGLNEGSYVYYMLTSSESQNAGFGFGGQMQVNNGTQGQSPDNAEFRGMTPNQ